MKNLKWSNWSAGFAGMDAGEGREQERKLRLLSKRSLHSAELNVIRLGTGKI